MTEPTDALRQEAANPATDQARLAELAYAHEELRAVIAANPSTYQGLLDWLGEIGDAHTKDTVAWVRAGGHEAAAAHAATQAAQAHAADAAAQLAAAQAANAAQPGAQSPFGNPFGAPQQAPAFGQQVVPAQGAYSAAVQPGAYPAQQPYGGYTPGTPQVPARRSKKWLFIGIAAGLVVLLAGGGVFAYATIFSKLGGAGSPQAAVEKLVGGVASLDAVSVYGSLSPAELGSLSSSFDRLKDIKTGNDGTGVKYQELLERVMKATKITAAGMKYTTTELDEGISKVDITAGTITIDTDAAAVADIVSQIAGEQLASSGYTASEQKDMIADSRKTIEKQINDTFPYTFDTKDARNSNGDPFALVTVKEGGAWYVSPLLTLGEYSLASSGAERGTLVDPAKFDSPDAAFSGLLDGVQSVVATGNIKTLAAALPLAERRYVSLYGSALTGGFGGSDTTYTFDNISTSSEESGSTAKMQIQNLDVTSNGYSSVKIQVQGVCASVTTEYDTSKGCLDDQKVLKKLGVNDVRIIAVKEDGGWFVSPLQTVTDAAAILSGNLAKLSENGELEDLFK